MGTKANRLPRFEHRGDLPGSLPIAPIALCLGASAVAAWTLHAAPDRASAAWVIAPGVAWGLAAAWAAWQVRDRPAAPLTIAVAAIAARLLLVGTPLHLSDDAWRYVWEGQVLNAGLDPFTLAPNDVAGLDDAVRARVNHPTMASIYPPLALWWFRLVALAGAPWAAQLGAALADAGTAALIAEWRRGRPGWPAWLYALHPLAALESASGAHLEALALCATTAGVLAYVRRRDHAAVLLVMAGAGLKVLPIALIGRIARGRSWWTAFGAVVALILLAWPVWGAGAALFTSATTYASTWSFNGLTYPLLAPIAGPATRPVLVATGAAMTLGAYRYASGPVGVWTAVGTAFVVLSPTVHPWYVLWVVVPSLLAGTWGWSLAGVAFLGSYAVLVTLNEAGGWREQAWLPLVTWVPAIAALAAEWAVSARAGR